MKLNNGAFVGVHAALWGVLAVGGLIRAGHWAEETRLPELRETPLAVMPEYDYDVVVSDEQLQRVLTKLQPPFAGRSTKINHVDHALRFWTPEAQFTVQPMVQSKGETPESNAEASEPSRRLTGEHLRHLLTDNRLFQKVYGEQAVTLLTDEPTGVGTRVQEGATTSSHVDHTVACLAEAGTPLSFPVYSPGRETTYRAMVEHTLQHFSLNQIEYEWSALTFALFVPPTRQWRTSEGQEISFDTLARRIMRERQPLGVCFGNHRLHTLTVFLRVDQQEPILSDDVKQEIHRYLLEQTAMLVAHQHPDGFWNQNWPFEKPASAAPTDEEGDRLGDRILATGHALEWWALAPAELHPPRPVLAAAGQWLVREIDNLTDADTLQYYTYLTHAGRALSLWRGKLPPEVPLGPTPARAEPRANPEVEAAEAAAGQEQKQVEGESPADSSDRKHRANGDSLPNLQPPVESLESLKSGDIGADGSVGEAT